MLNYCTLYATMYSLRYTALLSTLRYATLYSLLYSTLLNTTSFCFAQCSLINSSPFLYLTLLWHTLLYSTYFYPPLFCPTLLYPTCTVHTISHFHRYQLLHSTLSISYLPKKNTIIVRIPSTAVLEQIISVCIKRPGFN